MTSPDPRSDPRPEAPQPPSTPWGARSPVPAPGSSEDRQWAAFIGPRWTVYRRKFLPFFEDGRFTPTWNWAAALVAPMPFWFLYRKLYLPFVFFLIAPNLAMAVLWEGPLPDMESLRRQEFDPDFAKLVMGVLLSLAILAGGTANFLLYRRGAAALRVLSARGASAEAVEPVLARVGGVSWFSVLVGVVLVLLIQGLAAGSAGGR